MFRLLFAFLLLAGCSTPAPAPPRLPPYAAPAAPAAPVTSSGAPLTPAPAPAPSYPVVKGIPAQANTYRARLIREVHAHWGLTGPVAIFAAQLHQESGWREDARSPVGALGLAQFMPGTATWIAQVYPKELGEGGSLDAGWSLRAVVVYDRWIHKRVSGFQEADWNRWAATLSGYNGGLGWVQKDKALAGQQCDTSLWWGCVERFSRRSPAAFEENRGYPVRIIRLYRPRYEAAGW